MKKNFLSLMALFAILHIFPVIQSCDLFMRCGDPMEIRAKTAEVKIEPYSFNRKLELWYDSEPPFDRNNLRVSIDLMPDDSLSWLAEDNLPWMISAAQALKCEEDILTLEEHITNLRILSLSDTSVNEQYKDVTTDFVVETSSFDLYEKMEPVLASGTVQHLRLAYMEVPQADSIRLVINTTLSDKRIFSDTLTIPLQ